MAIPNKAITRNEQYLAAMAGQSGTLPDEPITRKEHYLAKAAGQNVDTPEPITREEMYLDVIADSGGGSGVTVNPLSVSENGTYTAPSGTAYSPVTVDVQGSSGEIVVADYMATEDVAEIVVSGDFGNYDYYRVVLSGTTTQDEWLYPNFQAGTVQKGNYIDCSGSGSIGTSVFNEENATIVIGKMVSGLSSVYAAGLRHQGTTEPVVAGNIFNYFSVQPYYASSLFRSGFRVQIYGGRYA